ncbi:type II secretion system minor pseudopilin GspJ [Yersinia enterocolitica]|uniref:type II secretion system minor pseudopilin GspJ n=1 Tax=Yersinia enterocolitica TaxID=630 RepID=UPI0005E7399E|nr:type II secretion system minor pseudopilin GspJ [Yersinia enterocolitica]CNH30876.1 general secretion pathway protein J [Yersinia enterocolitica]
MNKKNIQGLTLLEILLAIIIFTLISLTVYQAITVTSIGSRAINIKAMQVSRLQRIVNMLEQDISHAVIYSQFNEKEIIHNGIRSGALFLDSDDFGIMFLCDIGINTDLAYYSQSQIFGYRLRNGHLEKLTYSFNIKQPKVLKILDGVTAFRIHIYHKNRWLNEWTDTNFLPEAVELIIEMENIGIIRKKIILLNYAV